MGALTNIDQEGFASVAFHSFPNALRWDAYSGDYGPNFLGHALNTGTYVVNHPEFGWQAFGGNVTTTAGRVRVQVLDSFRRRVYLAPFGMFLTLESGVFESVEVDPRTGAVRVTLAPATSAMPQARLRIEQPGAKTGAPSYKPAATFTQERTAFVVPLGKTSTTVTLTPGR
jgi:hypothetical protein